MISVRSLAESEREDAAGGPQRGGWRHPPRPALALAVVVVAAVLVAGVLIFDRWRNGLHMFSPAGDEVGADRMPVGRTFYTPSVWSPTANPLTLAVTSIRPDIADNSAHATIRILLCSPRPGLTSSPGAAWSLTRWCSTVRPFAPGTYRLCSFAPSPACIAVFVAVTPRTSGHVHINGVHIKYEHGFRRGDQLVGIAIDTTTPRGV